MTREDLADEGVGWRRLTRMQRGGELVAVRPGVYAWAADTDALPREERIVVRARALDLVSREPPLFSHLTAAAIHGYPVYGSTNRSVHVILPPERPGRAVGVIRHRGDVPQAQRVVVHGLLCTSSTRTIADIARTSPHPTAVCAADAALREHAHAGPGRYLLGRAEEFRTTARDIAAASAHGRRRAERALSFADGRAQLPGESVSRIHLATLGFAPPELQVRVTGIDGKDDYVDFGLHDVPALGEFDGKGKYADPGILRGRTPAEVLDAEKQREDWIRGTTQLRFARWGFAHLGSAAALGARLAAFGITPPA